MRLKFTENRKEVTNPDFIEGYVAKITENQSALALAKDKHDDNIFYSSLFALVAGIISIRKIKKSAIYQK